MASANEVGDGLHSPHYHWPHEGMLDSYDHGSIRRGHQVCCSMHWRMHPTCKHQMGNELRQHGGGACNGHLKEDIPTVAMPAC